MYVSGFTAFWTLINNEANEDQRISGAVISTTCAVVLGSIMKFVVQLTDAHHITVDVLKVRWWFWCCAIPTTVAKLVLAFFLTHFSACYNCLYKSMESHSLSVSLRILQFQQLTLNTRELRAHMRRCSFDKCNAFLQISSWLWCTNAFGSNRPTLWRACNPRSLWTKEKSSNFHHSIQFVSFDKSWNELHSRT